MRNVYILGMVLLSVAMLATTMPSTLMANVETTSIDYHSMVCVYKNNELVECSHNALTNAGKEAIEDLIGAGTAGAAFDYIALGNGSTPSAGSTSLDEEIGDSGLERAQGTVNQVAGGSSGNWSVTNTFTATGAVGSINTTSLFNNSFPTNISMFAYNTFTEVSLQAQDQINVTWTIWVT
ncbi:MAG: hypothetical protein JW700_02850 [Candidatus Aenigmarchaeota archaeon]|nr:hypothetical protein [Candidatus Aenigmarchaeota archaeon]